MKIEYSKGNRTSKELILLNRQQFEATSGRKMKVMLIFPPDWFPSEPYLSLPSLTAVLRQAGHTVIQKDINLEMWDWYFSEDFLKKVLRRVPRQLDRLRKLSRHDGAWADEVTRSLPQPQDWSLQVLATPDELGRYSVLIAALHECASSALTVSAEVSRRLFAHVGEAERAVWQ